MLTMIREQLSILENPAMLSISALCTALLTYTGGETEAFITWCVLSGVDLIFGTIFAIVKGEFCVTKLYRWVAKVFCQLGSILLFASVLHLLSIAASINIVFANWLLFFYALMDATSIMDKLYRLGFFPRPAYVLLKFLRKRAADTAAAAVGTPELAHELEHALATGASSRSSSRRRRRKAPAPDSDTVASPPPAPPPPLSPEAEENISDKDK